MTGVSNKRLTNELGLYKITIINPHKFIIARNLFVEVLTYYQVVSPTKVDLYPLTRYGLQLG